MKIKLLLLLFAFVLPSYFSKAQSLDATFGNNGKVIVSFNSGYDDYSAVEIQSDGKALACGYYPNPPDAYDNAVLVRYNVDGSEDTSFGVNGRLYTGVMQITKSDAIALQPDGKILVVGCKANGSSFDTFNFIVKRYNADGMPDMTFADSGTLEIDMNGFGDIAYAVKIQNEGKIIVAGSASNTTIDNLDEDFAVLRLLTDGTLDTTFGTNGKTIVDFGNEWVDVPYYIGLQNDGKILIAGSSANNYGIDSDSDHTIIRLTDTGNLDTTFGISGKVATDYGSTDYLLSLKITSDGGFITGGLVYEPSGDLETDPPATYRGIIAKYSEDGTLDANFGTGGSVIFPSTFPNVRSISDILVIDGKYLCSGNLRDETAYETIMVRFNNDGSLDNTFDGDGIMPIDLGSVIGVINSMEITPDNKIVGVGRINSPGDSVIMRFDSAGLGLNNNSVNNYSVYPNPFTSILHFDFNLADMSDSRLELYDVSGKKVKTFNESNFVPTSNGIDLPMPENLTNGMYVLRVSDGKNSKNIKVIK